MGFMEAWGFDPEQIISAGPLSSPEIVQEGIIYNIDEDDPIEIPADFSTQVSELWRIFDLEQGL
jgi:hypothetical protein